MRNKFAVIYLTSMMLGMVALAAGEVRSVGDFSTGLDGWIYYSGREFPGAEGNLWHEAKEGLEGKGAACLAGSFKRGGHYVAMTKNLKAPLGIDEVRIRLKSNVADFISVRLKDSSAQTFQYRLDIRPGPGWQTVKLKRAAIQSFWGGVNDGTWHGPAKEIGIIVDRNSDTSLGGRMELSILIDSVEILTE